MKIYFMVSGSINIIVLIKLNECNYALIELNECNLLVWGSVSNNKIYLYLSININKLLI